MELINGAERFVLLSPFHTDLFTRTFTPPPPFFFVCLLLWSLQVDFASSVVVALWCISVRQKGHKESGQGNLTYSQDKIKCKSSNWKRNWWCFGLLWWQWSMTLVVFFIRVGHTCIWCNICVCWKTSVWFEIWNRVDCQRSDLRQVGLTVFCCIVVGSLKKRTSSKICTFCPVSSN